MFFLFHWKDRAKNYLFNIISNFHLPWLKIVCNRNIFMCFYLCTSFHHFRENISIQTTQLYNSSPHIFEKKSKANDNKKKPISSSKCNVLLITTTKNYYIFNFSLWIQLLIGISYNDSYNIMVEIASEMHLM